MKIGESDAKDLTDDYIANGGGQHFDINGNRIKGFIFTRAELNVPLAVNCHKHLFLMLALSQTQATPFVKHLNVIVGANKANACELSSEIHLGKLEITNLQNTLLIDSTKLSPHGIVWDINTAQLNTMSNDFLQNGSNANLYSSPNSPNAPEKIRGYHIDDQDLVTLGLDSQSPGNSSPNDEFIFIPVIRSKRLTATPFNTSYLSFAVAPYNSTTGAINSNIIEYCLPCPSACPSNYPIQ